MGNGPYELDYDSPNPLVNGLGFVLTILYTYLIGKYLIEITDIVISHFESWPTQTRVGVFLMILSTTSYLSVYGIENYLWTDARQDTISKGEVGSEVVLHGIHIFGALLLIPFVVVQLNIMDGPEPALGVLVATLAGLLSLRYLFHSLWMYISTYKTNGLAWKDIFLIGIHYIHRFGWGESLLVKRLGVTISNFMESIGWIEYSIENFEYSKIYIDEMAVATNFRHALISIPFYIISSLFYFTWLLSYRTGSFSEFLLLSRETRYIVFSLVILIHLAVYVFIIWRPFYLNLLKIT
jgi:hypothetical protein